MIVLALGMIPGPPRAPRTPSITRKHKLIVTAAAKMLPNIILIAKKPSTTKNLLPPWVMPAGFPIINALFQNQLLQSPYLRMSIPQVPPTLVKPLFNNKI